MITKEDYLDAKKTLIKSIEICRLYKLQPKEKYKPKKKVFSIEQKKEFLELLFKKEKNVSYSKIVMAIYLHFSVGVVLAKKILTEMKNENLITQNGKRGNYE